MLLICITVIHRNMRNNHKARYKSRAIFIPTFTNFINCFIKCFLNILDREVNLFLQTCCVLLQYLLKEALIDIYPEVFSVSLYQGFLELWFDHCRCSLTTFKWLYNLHQVWSLVILKPCGHLNLLVLYLWLFLNSLCGVAAHHPFIHFLLPPVLHLRLQGAGA